MAVLFFVVIEEIAKFLSFVVELDEKLLQYFFKSQKLIQVK